MNKTKLTSLLLAALTLLSAAACSAGTSTEDTGTTAPADTTAEAVTTEAPAPYYLDALSDKTFDGAVFTMIGEDYEQRPNFCLQEYTGVTINDAVYERQLALEARYDIDIEYRSETSRGPAAGAVGPAKQRRVILAAQRFLQQSGLSEHPVRFDVVEVTPATGGGLLVHCIRSAFEL